jgi:hypothetical protein
MVADASFGSGVGGAGGAAGGGIFMIAYLRMSSLINSASDLKLSVAELTSKFPVLASIAKNI